MLSVPKKGAAAAASIEEEEKVPATGNLPSAAKADSSQLESSLDAE